MKLQKLNKGKTLRIRLSPDEWEYLLEQKKKGRSYNRTIRLSLQKLIKIKYPF